MADPAETLRILKEAQEVILRSPPPSEEEVTRALAAVDATGDPAAMRAVRGTLQWLDPRHQPGPPPPAGSGSPR